jgi:hypothetical protein
MSEFLNSGHKKAETSHPISLEDVDNYGLIIRSGGEVRFWLDGSDNPQVFDYRAGRFLSEQEAFDRLGSLEVHEVMDEGLGESF